MVEGRPGVALRLIGLLSMTWYILALRKEMGDTFWVTERVKRFIDRLSVDAASKLVGFSSVFGELNFRSAVLSTLKFLHKARVGHKLASGDTRIIPPLFHFPLLRTSDICPNFAEDGHSRTKANCTVYL